MGSFAGVKIDAQHFQQTVDLAQQKALNEQYRVALQNAHLAEVYRTKKDETSRVNDNKIKVMIVGAFILGFLLSKD
jgi:hypothetical protein